MMSYSTLCTGVTGHMNATGVSVCNFISKLSFITQMMGSGSVKRRKIYCILQLWLFVKQWLLLQCSSVWDAERAPGVVGSQHESLKLSSTRATLNHNG